MDWLYAIIQLIFAIVGALMIPVLIMKTGFMGISLLLSVFSFLVNGAAAEGVRLGVDIAALLVRGNHLLAGILEKTESR
jgi:hypothetical protein